MKVFKDGGKRSEDDFKSSQQFPTFTFHNLGTNNPAKTISSDLSDNKKAEEISPGGHTGTIANAISNSCAARRFVWQFLQILMPNLNRFNSAGNQTKNPSRVKPGPR